MSYKQINTYNKSNYLHDPYNHNSYILEKFVPLNYGNKTSVSQNRFSNVSKNADILRQTQIEKTHQRLSFDDTY